ncbi:MAG: CDP-diacylglycerol--serine O-phosphatidyltransferase, partial [Halomonas sp.]|nr:CDP-diacylglycerol--serine O-phosphatidyltransferase [Halomonas sp.]
MTQDARDQEQPNSDHSGENQSANTQPDTADQSELGGNEDLAAAFLRETEVVEEAVEDGKKVRRKGIYLLPNLFTTSALFSGFFAVVAGINGDFTAAA